MVQQIDTPSHSVDVSDVSSHQSQFQPGHRVVLQSVKGDVITGTVRWVGEVEDGGSSIPTVGVETVSD